ncbi:RNA polymerase sigma-70 factor (ECF subfamily) [Pseudobacter ginsenosidimutans]|uniref:RNA polymerase sigma-70 factor (ECF subfamily) n=1 Tax=Pseudobacter ginsenosidimutans TaxID=661488 RepID=A0A4Q7N172_9BACT|nr:RNA polymerase sigma-70 factor (ECF subfamily) [Pseudobacter ginsenosidimutans]
MYLSNLATNPLYGHPNLLQPIANGDEQAFATLYRLYVPRLIPLIKSMTKDEELVKEVIQDTFARLWLQRERLAEVEYPHTYILRITSYVCVNYIRRSAIGVRVMTELEKRSPQADNSITETVSLKDLERIIRTGILQLTPAQQKIYRLSREEGLSIPEIAERLNISPNTVKNTLVASLKSIREYAKKAGYSVSLFFCWIFI